MSGTFDARFSPVERGLLSRVERQGSSRAVAEMSDPELDQWTRACRAMAARTGLANSARRSWKRLLAGARAERSIRDIGDSTSRPERS
jgi:hypothetical protein